ncbi:MAG: dihydrolipoyl dehydrogenase [Sphaerochaetaceae bacterium]|jgi:dihydrolipoamide dehydrogenase|nr:dihydrolipoyl dehydrogenase [Sphaerochaetaceae bacterium]HHU89090.1 dihydrolipoyl dehydrogenase [Spirochaetales bacterium]
MSSYNLIVIGSGPGGYIAAQRAGALGKKVLLIERDNLGGVCTNVGCIPTKSLLNSAKHYRYAQESEAMGVSAEKVTFDLTKAMAWKKDTVETLRSGIAFLMKVAKADVVFGEAVCLDANRVQVGQEVYQGENIIIATGSSPAVPPIPGSNLPNVLTSTEILSLEKLPASLVVIGGGVIGVEFASFFASVGVEVAVIEMMDEILPMVDKDMAKLIRREMKPVEFYLSSKVTEIKKDGVLFTNEKGESQELKGEMVLLSVGRRPNLEAVKNLKLDINRGGIVVDETLRTNIPNIYAIGDVNGKSLLAHSASRMAEVVVSNLYGKGKQKMRYNAIPWAVYGMPEVAGCGLTEDEAKRQGREVLSATVQMRSNGRFLAENGKRAAGLCKVVVDAKSRAILGVHLLGPYSSEIIYGAAAIIEAELRIEDVKEIVFPHPSVSEIIRDTLYAIEETL